MPASQTRYLRGNRSLNIHIKRPFMLFNIGKLDGLVKSRQGRHSRESGSPELDDFTGFPLSRE